MKSKTTTFYLDYDAAAAKSLQSCLTLCYPIDGSLPGSPILGILQARTLEWVVIPFSKCMKVKRESEDAQLYQRPHGLQPSYIHGIFQARVPEWGAIAFSELNKQGDNLQP